ncbi:hypothetical protein, partial [Sideroxydans sp. CL21]
GRNRCGSIHHGPDSGYANTHAVTCGVIQHPDCCIQQQCCQRHLCFCPFFPPNRHNELGILVRFGCTWFDATANL